MKPEVRMPLDKATYLRLCCVSGLLGSLLFLAGDMLFYGTWSSGAAFRPHEQMAELAVRLLVIGGAIGPVAALFSAIGMGVFGITLERGNKRTANVAAALLAIMMLIGGSYHAVYTCLGFASKVIDDSTRQTLLVEVASLRSAIGYPLYAAGLTGTALVYWLALTKKTDFPRWLLLFLPTTLSLTASAFRDYFVMIPAPVGFVIRGGWINGSFALFFVIAALRFWKSPSSEVR